MTRVWASSEIESPLGRLRAAATERGIARIELPRSAGEGFTGWVSRHIPDGEQVDWLPALDKLAQQLPEYFAAERREFDLDLELIGTPFQRSVWAALREIPYGETRSYGDLARALARPGAVRAVGQANGANPLPIVVPCHRVIAADGGIGGFGGGLDAKRRLLALEKARIAPLL